MGPAYLLTNGAFLLFFISLCLHHRAFEKMFRHFLREYDDPSTEEPKKKIDAKFLCDLIRFHMSFKKWVISRFYTLFKKNLNLYIFGSIFRFFLKSAAVYSPIIAFELICSTIFMACILFHLDLVIYYIVFTNTRRFHTKNIIFSISAIQTSWYRYCHWHDCIICWYGKSGFVQLLWDIGHQKLWTNGRPCVWYRLAWFTHWTTKVFHLNHPKCPKTNSLSWIWCCHPEYGDILYSMCQLAWKIYWFYSLNKFLSFQVVNTVFTYYMMFKTITSD